MSIQYLYAYPDHDVVNSLLPDARHRYITPEKAIDYIRQIPGLVPIAIDPEGAGKIYWADFGERPFREWQFMYSIKQLAEEHRQVDAFVTDMTVLETEEVLGTSLPPRGFIFHISRCGSTLLAKALAREPSHLVINQGGPLQRGFWAQRTANWQRPLTATDENLAMFRRLVLGMTRRRRRQEKTAFVKFISWNVLYVDFIRQAFPDVPCLFMYRDPIEVIASIRKETTAPIISKKTAQAEFLSGLPEKDIESLDDTTYLAHCFARYFESARDAERSLPMIDYRSLNSASFAGVLEHAFDYVPSARSHSLMCQQFAFHAKDDNDRQTFKGDSALKQSAVSEADRQVIDGITRMLYLHLGECAGDMAARLEKTQVLVPAAS
ncbi:MAG: hypothetical protein ACR2Q4_12885 [Geminicoccaceae bacterium]